MKKIIVLAMVAMALTIFYGCQKDELVSQLADEQPQAVVKPDVSVENGYLVFKDFDTYARISDKLDLMSKSEFENWEKGIGFLSANSLLNEVYSKLEIEESEENYQKIKAEYEEKLIFTPDKDILLPFYATAWQRVLNPEGEIKIGQTLYKFFKDREVMIMDGTKTDLLNLDRIISDTTKVKVFYPNKNSLLKSVQWGTLISGSPEYNNFRLEYSYQLISLYYTGYGLGSTYYTEVGFELKHWMRQKRKKIWWSYNDTQYYLTNMNLNIDFYKKVYDMQIGFYPNITWTKTYHDFYSYNQSIPDYTSSETNQGCTYMFMRFYDVYLGHYYQVEPQIHSNSFTFWSRGFDYNNRITINYSNQ